MQLEKAITFLAAKIHQIIHANKLTNTHTHKIANSTKLANIRLQFVIIPVVVVVVVVLLKYFNLFLSR